MAVDTLGHLLALHVTPASEQDRAQVGVFCEAMHEVTGESVGLVYANQGDTGEESLDEAAGRTIILEVVRLLDAKMGFVLLPRRRVAGRSFAGWPGFGGGRGTMSGWRRPWRACTTSPSAC